MVTPFYWSLVSVQANETTFLVRTRYYDPSVGRWTQQDAVAGSIGDPSTVNRYVGCDPVNYVDLDGRRRSNARACTVGAAIGGIAAGIAVSVGLAAVSIGTGGVGAAPAAAGAGTILGGLAGGCAKGILDNTQPVLAVNKALALSLIRSFLSIVAAMTLAGLLVTDTSSVQYLLVVIFISVGLLVPLFLFVVRRSRADE